MARALVLNAGSATLKFGLFDGADGGPGRALITGLVDRLGGAAELRLHPVAGPAPAPQPLPPAQSDGHAGALAAVLAALAARFPGLAVDAVGHRVVHGGMAHDAPATVTPAVLAALEDLVPLAPLHQPHNLAGIRAATAVFPDARQVACFDTAFHRHHPFVHDTYALPRAYYDRGVRRYGFHGLSYQHIAEVLADRDPALHAGRVIVAHLGSGASICALEGGRSVASSMGFTALDGLAMGTRPGQIDPGVVLYLLQHDGLDADAVADLLYRRSGLLGLSGISHDMRQLLASDDPRAAQAIDYFCARIRQEIGGLAAALGGLDGLVFTGGIGENAAAIRARVCEGMGWIGLRLDAGRNATGAQDTGTQQAGVRDIGATGAAVRVLVIPADEERVIARAALAAI